MTRVPDPIASSVPREKTFKIIAVIIALLIATALGEVCLRLFCKHSLALIEDERSLAYRYDPELGWFPKASSTTAMNASRPITATHNSDGFRDVEFVASTNPSVLFLGDSFVWGYDVNAPERFTDKLQVKHPEWKIYNCGVSGYGNDQEYLLLQKMFDHFKPRIVFLMYCTETDYQDNAYSFGYGYYKPYFTSTDDGRVIGHGIPVPRGERVFWAEHKQFPRLYVIRSLIKAYYKLTCPEPVHLAMREGRNENPTAPLLLAINEYVRSKGAALVVGITDANPKLEGFLQQRGIPTVDLSNPHRYAAFGKHWTPEGHDVVRDKVEQTLQPFLTPR
ncbi:MAG: SGNH/GDSL hydrolase family protein [Limisphaerales bacterium]